MAKPAVAALPCPAEPSRSRAEIMVDAFDRALTARILEARRKPRAPRPESDYDLRPTTLFARDKD